MKKICLFLVLFICCVFVCLPASHVLADGVEINTASLAQLDEIVGIGPAIGQRIIDARPFSSVDDLLRVKGIGDKTLQKIKDQGLAYVQSGAQQTTPIVNQAQNTNTTNQTQSETPIPQTPIQPLTAITYPNGIVINEILPSPEGPDETDEWIELYNKNNADVSLGDWKLQDTNGSITTYTFPKNTVIESNGYMTLKRPTTHIILNNQEDGVNLLWPDGKIIDSVSYVNATNSQSYSKINSDWQWSNTLTPGSANNINAPTAPAAKSVVATKMAVVLPEAQKTDNKYLSAIGQSINLGVNEVPENSDQKITSNPWPRFLGALAIIIILAITILLLKFRVFKKPTI